MYGIQKNHTDEPIYGVGTEAETQRTDVWTQQGMRGQDELGDQS